MVPHTQSTKEFDDDDDADKDDADDDDEDDNNITTATTTTSPCYDLDDSKQRQTTKHVVVIVEVVVIVYYIIIAILLLLLYYYYYYCRHRAVVVVVYYIIITILLPLLLLYYYYHIMIITIVVTVIDLALARRHHRRSPPPLLASATAPVDLSLARWPAGTTNALRAVRMAFHRGPAPPLRCTAVRFGSVAIPMVVLSLLSPRGVLVVVLAPSWRPRLGDAGFDARAAGSVGRPLRRPQGYWLSWLSSRGRPPWGLLRDRGSATPPAMVRAALARFVHRRPRPRVTKRGLSRVLPWPSRLRKWYRFLHGECHASPRRTWALAARA